MLNLIELLPDFYGRDSPEMADIQNTFSAELANIIQAKDDCVLQLDVNTATWGIELWEKVYGIKTDTELSWELRRRQITAKMCGIGTTMIKTIEAVAGKYADCAVTVEEIPAEYRFIIRFHEPRDFCSENGSLAKSIAEIKPAHLACEIIVNIAPFIFRNKEAFVCESIIFSARIQEDPTKKFCWNRIDDMRLGFDSLENLNITCLDIDSLTLRIGISRFICLFSGKNANQFAFGKLTESFTWSSLDMRGWSFDDLDRANKIWQDIGN